MNKTMSQRHDSASLAARAAERRTRILAHHADNHADAEQWDLAFWQEQGPAARLSALVAIHADVKTVEQARHGKHS